MELRGLYIPTIPSFCRYSVVNCTQAISAHSYHVSVASLLPAAPDDPVRWLYGRCIYKRMPRRQCLLSASLHLVCENMLLSVPGQGRTTPRCAPSQNWQPVRSYVNPFCTLRCKDINWLMSPTAKPSNKYRSTSFAFTFNKTFIVFEADNQFPTVEAIHWIRLPLFINHSNRAPLVCSSG